LEKPGWFPLPDGKTDDMCIRLDTTQQRDRRTDGRTETVKQYRDLHAVHDDER